MASITVNLAPTIVSGTATVYPRTNWSPTVSPSGAPVGASTTTGSVGADGSTPFTGLTEGVEYVAYQASPDRYVNFRVLNDPGSANDPAQVRDAAAESATLTNVASSATNVTLKAANSARKGLLIFNDSTAILMVKYGATASASSFTHQIPAASGWTMPAPLYVGVLDGIWAAANGNARITELT